MPEVVTLRNQRTEAKSAFCMTPTAQEITDLLSACMTWRWLGVVVGNPGTSKTSTINAFRDEAGDVFVCRMTRTAAKLQPGLVKIADAVGTYAPNNLGADGIYQEIVRALGRHDDFTPRRKKLLVIDEAQHMDDDLLEAVRDLYDEVKCGIVLAGNFELSHRYKDGSNKRRYESFALFRGRIGLELQITAPAPEDIEAICTHNGISDRRAVKIVQQTAALPGALQKVRNLLEVAAELGDGTLNHEAIRAAALVAGIKAK